jgi:hypothetical protein
VRKKRSRQGGVVCPRDPACPGDTRDTSPSPFPCHPSHALSDHATTESAAQVSISTLCSSLFFFMSAEQVLPSGTTNYYIYIPC